MLTTLMKSRPIELSVWRAPTGHLLAAVGIGEQCRTFLVDTAASASVITAAVLRDHPHARLRTSTGGRLRGSGGVAAKSTKVGRRRLIVGGCVTRQLPLTVANLDTVAKAVGVAIDGVLGLDVLAQGDLCADLCANQIMLLPPRSARSHLRQYRRTFVRHQFTRSAEGLVIVDVHIGDLVVPAILDTGAATTILNAQAADALPRPPAASHARRSAKAVGIDSRTIAARAQRLTKPTIGGLALRDVDAYVADLPVFSTLGFPNSPAMLLGLDLLDDLLIALDFERRFLYLSQSNGAHDVTP